MHHLRHTSALSAFIDGMRDSLPRIYDSGVIIGIFLQFALVVGVIVLAYKGISRAVVYIKRRSATP